MRIFRATARARPGSCRFGTFTVDAYATETTDTINTGTVGWSFTRLTATRFCSRWRLARF